MAFVSSIGALAFLGVLFLPSNIPMPPVVGLAKRLAPLADARIFLTLATTLLAMSGIFTVYTYLSVVFDRAIDGNPLIMGALLVIYGASGTFGNLMAGRIVDRVGPWKVLTAVMIIVIGDMMLFSWTGTMVATAIPAIAIWGVFSWSIQGPHQSRLVSLAPTAAPVVLGLNSSATYLGVTAAGVIGAAGIQTVGAHNLGFVGMGLVFLAFLMCQLATWRISAVSRAEGAVAAARA